MRRALDVILYTHVSAQTSYLGSIYHMSVCLQCRFVDIKAGGGHGCTLSRLSSGFECGDWV